MYRYTVQYRMIQSFRHRGLKRLHERGDPSKLRADQAERIGIALADLNAARTPQDLDLPGYRLHRLKGDLRDSWSIRVSANWRVIFRFEGGDVCDVDLVDYH
jgi:proteic killer suppression protein